MSRAWSFSTQRSRDGSICQEKPASDQTQDTLEPYTDPAQETRKPGGEEHSSLSNKYVKVFYSGNLLEKKRVTFRLYPIFY